MVSSRVFNLEVGGMQPLGLEVAGFWQVARVTGAFGVRVLLRGGDGVEY